MTKILKLKNGTPGQESAKAKLDNLRASGQISAENDALIQQLAKNGTTWMGENGKNLSRKERQAVENSLYESMYDIATGGQGYDPYKVGNSTVRQIVSDTMSGKAYTVGNGRNYVQAPQKITFTNNNSNTGASNIYWYQAPEASVTGSWAGLGTNDLKGTILNEGSKWLNNLQQLLNAKNQGLVVQNYKGNLGSLSQSALDSLSQYLTNLSTKETADYEDIGNFARIMSVLTPGESAYFTSVFQPFLDIEPQASKKWRELKGKGYTIDDSYSGNKYLTKNKYQVLKDNKGKQYIYDENFNLIQDPIKHIDLDTNDTVFKVGDNLFIGNIRDIDADKNHVLYKDIKDYQSSLVKKDAYVSDVWKEDYDASENDLTLALSKAGILKTGTKYSDVSNLFDGKDQVIAINNDGSSIKEDYYGRPDLSNASIYYIDGDGKYVKTNFTDYQQQNRYDRLGFGEGARQVKLVSKSGDFNNKWKNYADKDIDWDTDFYGESFWKRFNPFAQRYESDWENALSTISDVGFGLLHGGIRRSVFQDDIVDDPKGFAKSVVKSLKSWEEGKQTDHDVYILQNFKYDSDPLQLLTFLLNPKHSKQFQLSKEDRAYLLDLWNDAYKNETQGTYDYDEGASEEVESHKKGGILKYAVGAKTVTLTDEDTESDIEKLRKEDKEEKPKAPKEKGEISKKHKEKKLENEFSTSDILRLTSLGADLAGAIAAFAPGAGSAVALGTGLGSTAAELVADMSDPTVSFGSTLGNLVTNLGFTVAGVIPGAKIGKIGAKVLKWVPRITSILAAGNLALNEDIHDSLAKAVKEPDNLTVGDWRNITIAISSVLGITKSAKSGYTRHKAEKVGKSKHFIKEGLTTKALSEDQVKNFNKALKSGNEEEIKKLAQQYGLKEEGLKKYKEEIKRRSWDFWKERKGYKELEFQGNHDSKAMKKMYDDGDKATKEWLEYLYPGMKDRGWKNFQYTPGQKINMPKVGTLVSKGKKYNIPFKIKDQVHNSPLNPIPQAPMQPNQVWQPHNLQNAATSVTPNAFKKGPNIIQQQEELIKKKYLDDLDFVIQEQMKQMAGLNKKQLANAKGFNPKYGEQFKKAYNNSIKAKAPAKNNKAKAKSKKGGTPKKYLGGTILPWLNTVNY